MAEHVEKRGNRWYVRYKDNPDDPWHRRGSFQSQDEARTWLVENPVIEADDDDDDQA